MVELLEVKGCSACGENHSMEFSPSEDFAKSGVREGACPVTGVIVYARPGFGPGSNKNMGDDKDRRFYFDEINGKPDVSFSYPLEITPEKIRQLGVELPKFLTSGDEICLPDLLRFFQTFVPGSIATFSMTVTQEGKLTCSVYSHLPCACPPEKSEEVK